MPAAQLLQLQHHRPWRQRGGVAPLPAAGGGHQPLGEWLLGITEQLRGRPLLQQAPLIQHRHLLAPAARQRQVMGDQQQGTATGLTEMTQFGHHLGRHGHIKAGGGFIGDHQGGLQGHGQGDRQPLAHAPTELMGVTTKAIAANTHPRQQLLSPVAQLGPAPPGPMGLEGVGEMGANAEQGIEPGHRVLEHQTHRLTA